jgi:hypothetical protein
MTLRVTELIAIASAVAVLGCAGDTPGTTSDPATIAGESKIVVNDRSRVIHDFPCSQCHDNFKARPVKRPPRNPHSTVRLDHMDTGYECYQCHAENDMDMLVLRDETKVSIGESHHLCGGCHSLIKKDWDAGIHGKQVGSWLGTRHRYTCAECHDPHAPVRGKMKALPPPVRPKYGIEKNH